MGLFDQFKRKEQEPVVIKAPVKGTIIPMGEIPDPVISSGVLGTCCGIEPEEGIITAPIDGEIIQISDTLHAVGIAGENGVEILIHVGVDTVEMQGDGFEAFVKVGDSVSIGQKLLTMDLDKIRLAGYETCAILVVINSDKFADISLIGSGEIESAEDLLSLTKA